ncbi:MAG: MFS transporter [Dehalococcoidia bacterium]
MRKANKPHFFYGWVVLGCCFLAAFSYGIFCTIGVFFEPLHAEFGWSATLISSIQSLHIAIGIVSGLLIGWVTDKFGPKLILVCAGTLVGIGISLCSQVSELWHFYLFYGIASLGQAALWILPLSIVQKWFVKERGLTLGIAAAGIGAGVMVYTPIANSLILAVGWRLTYIIMSIGTWVLLMIAAGLIAESPENKGLKPLGIEEPGIGFSDSQANRYPPELWRAGEWSLGEALRSRSFWLLTGIQLCVSIPGVMIVVHVVPFAITVVKNETAAAAALALIGGLNIAGRIGMGTVAQKVGFKRVLIICTGVCAVMFIWLLRVQSLWMIYFFAIIFGFFSGGLAPQVPGLIGYFFPGKSLTTIFGTLSAISSPGSILGPLVGGLVWDRTGSYGMAFIIGASFWALTAILALLLKPPQKATS